MSGWPDIRRGIAGKRAQLTRLLKQPEHCQLQLLQEILLRNRNSEVGRRYDFASIANGSDYAARVPICGYESLRDDIRRMMNGEVDVLCSDPVLLFEETGGSTGGQKFIPFTARSIECMREAILPWLDDLLDTRPGIMNGHAYWAISPAVRAQRRTHGGTPIGIDSDAEWFGRDIAKSIDDTLAVPASVAKQTAFDAWRTETLMSLLACRDLSFVSVWSPTFFLHLLDTLHRDSDSVIDRLASACPDIASGVSRQLARRQPDWQSLWPDLDTISCWSSASSRRYADLLGEYFPDSYIQGKGLLATEGVVTLPLEGACAPVLAVNSSYVEFVDDDGLAVPLPDLRVGACYAVILTTAAGLYRYRLGDRVSVAGWYETTPCLEYVGREGTASDLCGEKLTEEFVRASLERIPGNTLLVPLAADRPGYLLLIDSTGLSPVDLSVVANQADANLMRNPQYRHARQLGQLSPLIARHLPNLLDTYQGICLDSGRRLGDIKPTALASRWWADAYLRAPGD